MLGSKKRSFREKVDHRGLTLQIQSQCKIGDVALSKTFTTRFRIFKKATKRNWC